MTLESPREAPRDEGSAPPARRRSRAEQLVQVPAVGLVLRHLGLLISIAAVAGFVAWALRQDPPQFPTAPGDIALVGAAVLAYAVATLLRGWRWHRIMRHNGVEHARSDAYALCVVGYAANNVLPARSGELLRIFLMSQRSSARKREVLGTVLAERVLDAVSLALLLVMLSIARVANSSPGDARTLVAIGALAALVLAFGVLLLLHRRERMQRVMTLLMPVVLASRRLVGLYGAVLLAVTTGIWMIEGLIFWLIGTSLSLDMSPFEGLFVLVVSGFFALIPAAPGYVGTFDAGVAVGLSRLGITGGAAVTFALLARFVLYVPITVVGLGILIFRYGGLRMLRSGGWREKTV